MLAMTTQGSIAGAAETPESAGAEAVAARVRAAAERALAEAAARKAEAASSAAQTAPREIDGRDGPEPVRFGDWEVKGVASDF